MIRMLTTGLTQFAMAAVLLVAGLAAFATSASAQPTAQGNVVATPEPSSIVVLAVAGVMLGAIILFSRYRNARNAG